MTQLTQQRLHELLDYDTASGVFLRKVSLSNRTPVGSVAGSVNSSDGYRYILVDGKRYAAHRLAWIYITGQWPDSLLDHIDMDRTNNALSNLRQANKSTNGANRGTNKNNTSGFKGVHYFRAGFVARIKVKRKYIHLGVFTTKEDAAKAYDIAALEHFGSFAITNRKLGLLS